MWLNIHKGEVMYVLNPKDKFTIINKSNSTDYDKKILTDLYQPIVGSLSILIYMTLFNQVKADTLLSKELDHESLLRILGINIDLFRINKEKLEGIGLIKTYKKSSEFIYVLYKPLDAFSFFNNLLLNTLLYNNLGNKLYKNILKEYKDIKIDLSEYSDVTKSFDQVFKTTSLLTLNNSNIINYESAKMKMASVIDFDFVLEGLPDISENLKEDLNNIAFLYNLKDSELRDLVLFSVNTKNTVDLDVLINRARDLYVFENSSLPTLKYIRMKTTDENESKKDKLIRTFENTSPFVYLKSKYKSGSPTKVEMKIIEDLLLKSKMEPEVINVLISYVLKVNNQKFTKNYVDTIASQWLRLGIKTAEAAMKHCTEFKNTTNKKVKVTSSKKQMEILPEWFDQKQEKELSNDESLKDLLNSIN